ncbi:hypothetical protein [Paenisporosarcina antarctica]|uniref:Uncharacterized protein n=1 Tax=Paenisporosarcina antarctica TaxID=417367 RepID=A0A4V1ANE2_9BACL|nr:hypothetical protein [Paenisporosarcina antarctica]QBP42465.1 hypothetical protein E2636_15495 [Paenisporosarcina antarctica]
MSFFSKIFEAKNRRKTDRSIEQYNTKHGRLMSQVSEYEMIEKIDPTAEALILKRQLMKEKIILIERERNQLIQQLQTYIAKHKPASNSRYHVMLNKLNK